jgi:hypothetical protein
MIEDIRGFAAVAVLTLGLGGVSAPAETPEQVVHRFCRLDLDGATARRGKGRPPLTIARAGPRCVGR